MNCDLVIGVSGLELLTTLKTTISNPVVGAVKLYFVTFNYWQYQQICAYAYLVSVGKTHNFDAGSQSSVKGLSGLLLQQSK